MKYKNWDTKDYVDVRLEATGKTHKYFVTGDNRLDKDKHLTSMTTVSGFSDGGGTFGLTRYYAKHAAEETERQISYALEHDEFKSDAVDIGKKYPTRLFQQAGERGSRIHKAFEEYFNGSAGGFYDRRVQNLGKILLPEEAEVVFKCIQGISLWMSQNHMTIRGNEIPVYHGFTEIGGTIDLLVSKTETTPEGKEILQIGVIDLKTGNSVHYKDYLQVSGYLACVVDMLAHNLCLWPQLEMYPAIRALWDENATDEDKAKAMNLADSVQFQGWIAHLQEDKENVTMHQLPQALIGDHVMSMMSLNHKFSKEKAEKVDLFTKDN